jgi:hypothetical protein
LQTHLFVASGGATDRLTFWLPSTYKKNAGAQSPSSCQ